MSKIFATFSFNIYFISATYATNILDGMSAREAAAMYGIPRSTIGDKLRGNSEPVIMKKGPETIMDKDVE